MILFPLPFFPEKASTTADEVDALFYSLVALCGTVTLAIFCVMTYFGIKYRRRVPDQMALPTSKHRWIEYAWTFTPLLIFIGIFVWAAHIYFRSFTPPADATEIYVVGKQWMWKFQHPEGQREINELHVPTGQPVRLVITSQDVIHSFFVPAFRVHRDAVPGRYTSIWFQATEPGTYHLFCSQYCGTQHTGMVGSVIVLPPDEYRRWLLEGGEGSLASQGQKLFRQLACNACHTSDSEARGPMLDNLYGNPVRLSSGETVIADDSYIRDSILNPKEKVVAGFQPIMPTFQNQISEEQIIQLIAYIKSLNGERRQIPPTFSPGAPQPPPVDDALKQSESKEQPK